MNPCVQVRQAKLEEGEQQFLRARLRQLEARRSSVERAGLVHLAVSGEGGVGGVVEALRNLEGHVDAILAQEEAHTGAKATGQNLKDKPEFWPSVLMFPVVNQWVAPHSRLSNIDDSL